jgi:hypothetical protein
LAVWGISTKDLGHTTSRFFLAGGLLHMLKANNSRSRMVNVLYNPSDGYQGVPEQYKGRKPHAIGSRKPLQGFLKGGKPKSTGKERL